MLHGPIPPFVRRPSPSARFKRRTRSATGASASSSYSFVGKSVTSGHNVECLMGFSGVWVPENAVVCADQA